jgi:MYXO-CTERM domain-containing protein
MLTRALRRLVEITLPLRPHPPGTWQLTSSLPQSPYCKYDSVGPSGRTRHPPRWAAPSRGKIIYASLLMVLSFLLIMPSAAHACLWYYTDASRQLHWEVEEVQFWADDAGIDYVQGDREYQIIQEAMDVWNGVDTPFTMSLLGKKPDVEIQFDEDPEAANENHIVFVKQEWSTVMGPGHDSDRALTRLSFIVSTGELVDVDIGFNNQSYWFTECDTATAEELGYQDFFYVILHELGHVTGLDHSGDSLAAMYPQDATCTDLPLHYLTPDDIECFEEYYGSDEYAELIAPEPDPDPEFSGEIDGEGLTISAEDDGETLAADGNDKTGPKNPDCGCRLTTQPDTSTGTWLLIVLLALGFAYLRRRRTVGTDSN